MSVPTSSLDRLHDLALPPPVPWWSLAPGWYIIVLVILVLLLVLVHRAWKRYRANAYRRAALRELAQARDVTTIAEVLRRTALAIAPRSVIAEKTGPAWPDWLARHCPAAMPDTVRNQLNVGIYGRPAAQDDPRALRDYATHWIATHHRPLITDH